MRRGITQSPLVARLFALLLIIVSTITVPVVVGARAAGADEISSLQAQAAQISQQLLEEQLQAGADQVQYQDDSAKVQQDQAHITRTERSIQADRSRITADTRRLAHQAILQYTQGGAPSSDRVVRLFSGNQRATELQAEYEQVAAGDTDTALAHLHTDQQHLQGLQATLVSQRQADSQVQQEAAGALADASSTQARLTAQQSQVKGQLAQAIAAQQAAEEAAAEAAIKAAQQRAAQAQAAQAAQAAADQASSSTQSSATSVAASPAPVASTAAPVSSGGSSGLPSMLACILQAESGGDYSVASPNGEYLGGFQFSQSTWNEAAQMAGQPGLVGVPPNQATPAQQDALAIALFSADGDTPWIGDRCTG